MTWFKVCDTLWGHEKAHAAGLEAMGLWVLAGSRCGQQLSDGFVPDMVLPMLGGSVEIAQRLVDSGLWTRVQGGYRFHDWADNNPLREQVEARREADKQRKRAVRSDGGADSARTAHGFPDGTGRSKKETASPRTPPRIADLCHEHGRERASCPYCKVVPIQRPVTA